ncbi:MAG TPA: hypothetical protein VMX17_13840 [Candidatus Glassbacteria bacterium]|nr:hypothetical protein [Candidatus Glassbacteria bacterium]
MSIKLEKLNEVNAQLNCILQKLETYVFIEKIPDVREKIVIAESPTVEMPIKQ